METYYLTLAGHKISGLDNMLTIPCLAGSDVSREVGEITVICRDGEVLDAVYEAPYSVIDETKLQGWGSLDGPAVDVATEDANPVTVPRNLWEALLIR